MGKQKKIITYSKGNNLNIRLRGKRLAKGTISLYLDYYTGYSKTEDNKTKTFRKIEYLKIYLKENPQTAEEREYNRTKLELAQAIRNKRESDYLHNPEGFISPYKKKINFLDYCQNYIDTYTKLDIRMVKGVVSHFKDFIGESYIVPAQINEDLMKRFRDYLRDKFSGETPNSYFARFKKILRKATDEGIFIKNPGEKITCPIPNGISKDILMPDEIIKLANTECGNSEIKRAFLFSLNTGLRFVDIEDLKHQHIKGDKLIKRQQKTGKQVTIDLNEMALKILGNTQDPNKQVFTLPTFTSCMRTLKNWAKKAGINKNLTWHSARHSFATILLMNQANIKTVSDLLGHSRLDHTEKYTHIVDELKKKAVNSLPKY